MITLKTLERTPGLAELKVSYKRNRPKTDNQVRMPFFVASPICCEKYLRSVWDKDTIELREEFLVVCLNGAHEVLGWVKLHTGGLNQSPVDLRMVLAVALQTASTSLILAHNHPSGSLTPSPEDVALTRRVKDSAALLGIKVLDHLIMTRDHYTSLSEMGLME